MKYLTPILAGATFTTGLSARAPDPVMFAIASDFAVANTTAVLLSSASASAFALGQPVTCIHL
jgi:predicted MFS family arabinose efflux permease